MYNITEEKRNKLKEKIIKTIHLYNKNPENFPINGAYWFFKINEEKGEYPIKAICRYIQDDLELNNDFNRDLGRSRLKKIFGKENIVFFDRNKYKENNIYTKSIEKIKSNKDIMNIKNIILYGSPGVGKTYNTTKLINLIENSISEREIFETIQKNQKSNYTDISNIKERVHFITFHQSFGYEDFIEGFRPNQDGKIELVEGIFKTICKKADSNREKKHYLVIDEINRGNISKIFGELITLIEEDKRDILEITLPYSKAPFKIPSNLYIIGTMNSTDKSIALIDIALRRRFTFLRMKPNSELIPQEARLLFIELNKKITETLGEDYQIGHSYFMNNSDLNFVIEYKIIPLLEEYYYGDNDNLQEILKIINKGIK